MGQRRGGLVISTGTVLFRAHINRKKQIAPKLFHFKSLLDSHMDRKNGTELQWQKLLY